MSDFNKYAPLLNEKIEELSKGEYRALRVDNPKNVKVVELYKKLGYNYDFTGNGGKDRTIDSVYHRYLELTSKFGKEYETRMEYDCHQCHNSIRNTNVVFIDIDGNKHTMWDIPTGDDQWDIVFKGMSDFIKELPVLGLYLVWDTKYTFGQSQTYDENRNKDWNHFSYETPMKYRTNMVNEMFSGSNTIHKDTVEFFNTMTQELFDKLKEIDITNDGDIATINRLHKQWEEFNEATMDKSLYIWLNISKWYVDKYSKQISNKPIGQTLMTIHIDGIDKAKANYIAINNVATRNVSSRVANENEMSDSINDMLDMGYDISGDVSDISGTVATEDDIPFTWKPTVNSETIEKDIISDVLSEANKKPKELKGKPIKLSEFVANVLPLCTKLEIAIQDNLKDNRLVVTKQVKKSELPIFNHGNEYSFTYVSGKTGVINERVTKRKGNVDAPNRFSLAWEGDIDLDLGLGYSPLPVTPHDSVNNEHGRYDHSVHYGNLRNMTCDMMLDLDANGVDGRQAEPVENAFIDILHDGYYYCIVHNFDNDSDQNKFQFLIKNNGVEKTYAYDKTLSGGAIVVACIWEVKNGIVVKETVSNELTEVGVQNSKQPILEYKQVKGITMSPNYWNEPIGNAHYIFNVDGLEWDVNKDIRFIHNEMLHSNLYPHRRTLTTFVDKKLIPYNVDMNVMYGFDTRIKKDILIKATTDGNTIPYIVTVGE